jgi:hypothetical protein
VDEEVAVAARGADQAAEEALACAVGVYAGLAVDKVRGDDEAGEARGLGDLEEGARRRRFELFAE